VGSGSEAPRDEPEPPSVEPVETTEPDTDLGSGSLFDLGAPEDPAPPSVEPVETTEPESEQQAPEPKKSVDIDEGGSLFDL
jgi:hypothetical protein